MNDVAVVLGMLVAGAVAAFVAWPWRMQREILRPAFGVATPHGEALAERREAVLTALRDLDFDRAVGKVAEEDYSPLRQTLLTEAAAVTTQLDEERATVTVEANFGALIEEEVLEVLQTLGADYSGDELASDNTCPACGRTFRPGDLYCAGCGAQLHTLCSECGRAARLDDLFCAGCGAKLALAVA